MQKTKIDWCDSTWNPVTGCYHKCEYCYARSIANRFGGWEYSPGFLRKNISGSKKYICKGKDYYGEVKETEHGMIADISEPFFHERSKSAYPFGFAPTLHRYRLDEYKKKKPRNIFVCSMADLFGEWVPDEWIDEVFKACENAPQHNYLFLTKNPERYIEYHVPIKSNMLYGTTITNNEDADRFNYLPAFCQRFVSIEPICDDIAEKNNLIFRFVGWVIVGAETGRRKNKAIPKREWIENIVGQCKENNIPVFMKSSLADIWGGSLIQEFPNTLKGEN